MHREGRITLVLFDDAFVKRFDEAFCERFERDAPVADVDFFGAAEFEVA